MITTLMKVIRDFVAQGVTPCSTKITQERMMMRLHNDFNFCYTYFYVACFGGSPAEEATKIVRFVFKKTFVSPSVNQ